MKRKPPVRFAIPFVLLLSEARRLYDKTMSYAIIKR